MTALTHAIPIPISKDSFMLKMGLYLHVRETNTIARATDTIDSIQAWDLAVLKQRAKEAVLAHARKLTVQNPNIIINHINLYLPCTFFMLKTTR